MFLCVYKERFSIKVKHLGNVIVIVTHIDVFVACDPWCICYKNYSVCAMRRETLYYMCLQQKIIRTRRNKYVECIITSDLYNESIQCLCIMYGTSYANVHVMKQGCRKRK